MDLVVYYYHCTPIVRYNIVTATLTRRIYHELDTLKSEQDDSKDPSIVHDRADKSIS